MLVKVHHFEINVHTFYSLVQIGIIEDEEWAITAKLEGELLQRIGAMGSK